MTSLRQVAANRRNASKSTGPLTATGKQRSRRNAVRHGLTAETVIGALEDAEDYKLFEAAITAGFVPQTAVERELVLRLASLFWRLRRATSIETGIFQNSTEVIAKSDQTTEVSEAFSAAVVPIRSLWTCPEPEQQSSPTSEDHVQLAYSTDNPDCAQDHLGRGGNTIAELSRRFLRLAADHKGPFERLGWYETTLWRQAFQTMFMLEVLRRHSFDRKWLPNSGHLAAGIPFRRVYFQGAEREAFPLHLLCRGALHRKSSHSELHRCGASWM